MRSLFSSKADDSQVAMQLRVLMDQDARVILHFLRINGASNLTTLLIGTGRELTDAQLKDGSAIRQAMHHRIKRLEACGLVYHKNGVRNECIYHANAAAFAHFLNYLRSACGFDGE